MDKRPIFLLLSLLLAMVPVTAFSAENHAPAKRMGDVDVSLLCPAGSSWYPIKGGACLGCPGNKKPKAGLCPGWQKARWAKASYSYKRKRLALCKPGTFKRSGTRECWTCKKKGYIRDPNLLKKFKNKNQRICFSPARPTNSKPKIVLQISLKDMLDPKRLKAEVRDLGCKSYGKKAKFSTFGGGTCWTCPPSHPKRTLNPVFSKSACGTASCGGLNERPCTILERPLPCNKGTSYNPFKQQCVAKKNIACKPVVNALRSVRDGVRKANELGQALEDKAAKSIPGMKVLTALMDGVTGKLDQAAQGLVSKLPTDRIQADLDRLFRKPSDVKDMEAVFKALGASRRKIEDMMLDPDVLCDDPGAIARLIVNKINASKRADAGDYGIDDALREFAGVGQAYAQNLRINVPFMRNRSVSFTSSASLFLKKGGVKVPIGFGLEFLIGVAGDGAVSVVINFVGGLDFPSKAKITEVGSVSTFASIGLQPRPNCQPVPIAVQFEAASLLGVSANHCGLVGLNLNLGGFESTREIIPGISVISPEGVAAVLSPAKVMKTAAGQKKEIITPRAPGPRMTFAAGINGALKLLTLFGNPDGTRSMLAP